MITYTIIGGVNGVGKSSFTGVLKEIKYSDLGIIIDDDKIISDLGGNMIDGGKAALQKIEECIKLGVSFTQETTLSDKGTANTIKKVKELGYHVRLYYIGLDTVTESLARIENRVRRGGHSIAEDKVVQCFATRWEVLAKVLSYCDEAKFYDNNNGFTKVAEYSNGEIRTFDNAPRWITELKIALNI